MTQTVATGRHRSAGRHNPLIEIKGIVARAGDTGVKASAVLAASGGLVAAFALPAQAAPSTPSTTGSSAATLTLEKSPAERSAAGVVQAEAPAVAAPALAAPADAEATVTGVTAEPIPAPEPEPVVVAAPAAQASNGGTTSTTQAAAPAPTVNIPSNSGIVSIAASLTGIWYVYGGSTPAGFDCSGFVQYIYAQAGISIPRTSSAQQAAATPVSNPQPGDLIFFGYPAYHVGIYIGNGQMIDSLKTGTQSGVRTVWTTDVNYGRF